MCEFCIIGGKQKTWKICLNVKEASIQIVKEQLQKINLL